MRDRFADAHIDDGMRHSGLVPSREEREQERMIRTARADLARKVLATVSAERLTENLDNDGDRGYTQALDDVVRGLQNLFRQEEIDLTTKEEKDVVE